MKHTDTKIVGETWNEIASLVTPTMGAKGRMAIIADEFARPIITDDGVTVAKECMSFKDPFKKMAALSMVEAANNTEKVAFDGTTLTVLMTNELYKAGQRLIESGLHPQDAADTLVEGVGRVLKNYLPKYKLSIKDNPEYARNIAYITTKIPTIGELVYKAHEASGDEMNVIIEHERKEPVSKVEHTAGMIINSGYFTDEFRTFCNDGANFTVENARIIMLSNGILTPQGLRTFITSLPKDYNQVPFDQRIPLIFVVDKSFNPESLSSLLQVINENQLRFMFIFINEDNPDEVFKDLAAKTNGMLQSQAYGTLDYKFEYAGIADKITIEKDKTTVFSKGDPERIAERIESYKKELEDNQYTTGYIRADEINRRLSNLNKGVVKIKLAASTITEYRTIRLKLDDAIGAVRCACKDGAVIGAGKTLYNIAQEIKAIDYYSPLIEVLESAQKTIYANAGAQPKDDVIEAMNNNKELGINVVTGLLVNLKDEGIIDSYTSVEQALINSVSIVSEYLRAYTLINGRAED